MCVTKSRKINDYDNNNNNNMGPTRPLQVVKVLKLSSHLVIGMPP